jgi:hypothetical protein
MNLMKWRLLEGGGQAIYELGVADSGALVGLVPDHLRASLDTLHAMAAEIGARVVISKEIEVTVADVPEAGFRAQVDKRHGSRDTRRTAAKEHPKAQTYPIVTEPSRSFVSTASTSTPSSFDSTGSLITDSCSLASDYSPYLHHRHPPLLLSAMMRSCMAMTPSSSSPCSPTVYLDAKRLPMIISVAKNQSSVIII